MDCANAPCLTEAASIAMTARNASLSGRPSSYLIASSAWRRASAGTPGVGMRTGTLSPCPSLICPVDI
jgi:hypothetical protein